MGNEKIGVSGLGRWVACRMDTFRCVLVPQVPHRATVSEQVSVGPRGCGRWYHRIYVNTSEPAFEVTLTQFAALADLQEFIVHNLVSEIVTIFRDALWKNSHSGAG